jgi:hypothetical protein
MDRIPEETMVTEPDEGEELGDPEQKVPVKLRRKVVRLLKIVAAHKGVFMSDYLEQIALEAITPEMEKMLGDMRGHQKRGKK